MRKILLVNGPNLNLLGSREPALYGSATLADIERRLAARAQKAGAALTAFQSNAEHLLVERIQQLATEPVDILLINPGAFGHTSIALRDALLAVGVAFIEVHVSNIYARESFRRHSYLSDIAAGCIVGLGPQGYDLALEAALARLAGAPTQGD